MFQQTYTSAKDLERGGLGLRKHRLLL